MATPTSSDLESVRMMFSKGPGRRGRVRFLPGCLVFSIVLTIVLNLVLRAF